MGKSLCVLFVGVWGWLLLVIGNTKPSPGYGVLT